MLKHMPLLEREPHASLKTLLLFGVPSLFIAVVCSMLLHNYIHEVVRNRVCHEVAQPRQVSVSFSQVGELPADCPLAALAAIGATLALGLAAFGLLVHFQRNILFAAFAFVNATMRLPEALTLFAQMALKRTPPLLCDEWSAFQLVHFKDSTAYLVILWFYLLSLFFFTVFVIHDSKSIPRKWLVAILLFVALPPFERFLLGLV